MKIIYFTPLFIILIIPCVFANTEVTNGTYFIEDYTGYVNKAINSTYPAHGAKTFVGIGHTFNDSDSGLDNNNLISVYAINNGSSSNVVALHGVANSSKNNSPVFGGNVISSNWYDTTSKLVGFEIDVQPRGKTSAGSGGLYINSFRNAINGPILQTGSLGGSSWQNGIIIGGQVNGTAFGVNNGAPSMTSMIDTHGTSYKLAAIIINYGGTGQQIRFYGSGGQHEDVYFNSTNNSIWFSGPICIQSSGHCYN